MSKRRSVFPSSCNTVLVYLSLAPTHTMIHTQREKIIVLARQERKKSTSVTVPKGGTT